MLSQGHPLPELRVQLIKLVGGTEGGRLRLLQAGCMAALLREASKNLSGTVRVEVVQVGTPLLLLLMVVVMTVGDECW